MKGNLCIFSMESGTSARFMHLVTKKMCIFPHHSLPQKCKTQNPNSFMNRPVATFQNKQINFYIDIPIGKHLGTKGYVRNAQSSWTTE